MKRIAGLVSPAFVLFLLAGVCLFAIDAYVHPDVVRLTEPQLAALDRDLESKLLRQPTASERESAIADTALQEMLFREAMAQGLHLTDEIVKRRMAMIMDFAIVGASAYREPAEAEIRAYFEANGERFRSPWRVSFRHVYFPSSVADQDARLAAEYALDRLRAGAPVAKFGAAFPAGMAYGLVDYEHVGSVFGRPFADAFFASRSSGWRGPIESTFGFHLVRVDEWLPPQPMTHASVRDQIVAILRGQQVDEARQRAYAQLRRKYPIEIDQPKPAMAAP